MQQMHDGQVPQITCLSSNKARMICISQNCSENGLICLRQDCQSCQTRHKYCQTYRINSLLNQLRSKRQQPNPEVIKSCQLLKEIYDQAVERISLDKQKITDQMDLYGLNQNQALLYKLLKEQRLTQLNGNTSYNALANITDKMDINLNMESVSRFWLKRKKEFEKIFDNFKLLLKKKYIKLQSKITDEIDVIEGFFEKPIYQFKLLYRASQHSHSVSKFHTTCDGVANTIVLAITQYGKIIGGFTPLKWNSQGNYLNDSSSNDKTFLFSISNAERYDVINHSYTIYGNASYGPTFGGGHDFYIGNSSATTQNSCYFNFPHSYNNGKYTNGQTSYTAFVGSSNGSYYSKIPEWQVFEVQFL